MYSNFATMPIRPELKAAVEDMGYVTPSPIQMQAIEAVLEGRDLIGQAQTGTGKTAAFSIPMLHNLALGEAVVQALVLCPTRELAIQVSEEVHRLGARLFGLKVLPVYGGSSIENQIYALKRGVHVVVGTPGRVKDHLSRGTLKLAAVRLLVLDEADEMLNMGFRDDIEDILKEVPEDAQRVFFSATMPEPIRKLTNLYLKHPQHLKIAQRSMTVAAIEQSYYEIKPFRKLEALARILEWEEYEKALVFCSTRRMVDELTIYLQNRGVNTDALHGDLAQSQRDRVMGRFRTGELRVLAATDVAARGLDVDDVDLVINFDLPYDHESYVHRVGRTGRAGRSGRAVSIISGREFPKLTHIIRLTRAEINRAQLPSLGAVLDRKVKQLLEKLAVNLSSGADLERFERALDSMELPDYKRVSAALLGQLLKGEMGDIDFNHLDDADDLHEAPYKPRRERAGYDAPRRGGKFERGYHDIPGKRGAPAFPRAKHGERHNGFGAPGKYQRKPGGEGPLHRGFSERDSRPGDQDMVGLVFNVGRSMGITPGDLVGAITNESRIPGKDIGHIKLGADFALVDVQGAQAERVLQAMNRARIRGLRLRVDLAED